MIDLDELERLYEAATPGEWGLCNDGKCKCMLLSGEDYPIATFEDGEWGDTYPAIRYCDGRGLSGTTVEAYMEIIPYGALPEGMGTANLRLTAALHNTAPELFAELRTLRTDYLEAVEMIDRREAQLAEARAENERRMSGCGSN